MSIPLSIDQIRALVATPVPSTRPDAAPALQIVIADQGWVFVGRVSTGPESVRVSRAAVVRRWGTTNGIGQLAREGPRKETVLDESPDVTIPLRSIIALIDCEPSKWAR